MTETHDTGASAPAKHLKHPLSPFEIVEILEGANPEILLRRREKDLDAIDDVFDRLTDIKMLADILTIGHKEAEKRSTSRAISQIYDHAIAIRERLNSVDICRKVPQ